MTDAREGRTEGAQKETCGERNVAAHKNPSSVS